MTITSAVPDRLIRAALRGNAVFSGVGGLAALLAAAPLADATDLPVAALRIVGAGLIAYALLLWRWSTRTRFRAAEGWTAVIADVAWVVGTIVLLMVDTDVANTAGKALLIGVAVVVAGFADAQVVGVRRLRA